MSTDFYWQTASSSPPSSVLNIQKRTNDFHRGRTMPEEDRIFAEFPYPVIFLLNKLTKLEINLVLFNLGCL